jgi:hypothetical protein
MLEVCCFDAVRLVCVGIGEQLAEALASYLYR